MYILILIIIMKENISIVWCGDFNFIPNSPMYTYMSQGYFNFDSINVR